MVESGLLLSIVAGRANAFLILWVLLAFLVPCSSLFWPCTCPFLKDLNVSTSSVFFANRNVTTIPSRKMLPRPRSRLLLQLKQHTSRVMITISNILSLLSVHMFLSVQSDSAAHSGLFPVLPPSETQTGRVISPGWAGRTGWAWIKTCAGRLAPYATVIGRIAASGDDFNTFHMKLRAWTVADLCDLTAQTTGISYWAMKEWWRSKTWKLLLQINTSNIQMLLW